MKKAFLILTFGLLLAVGWTNSAQAQALPAESLSKKFVTAVAAKSHQFPWRPWTSQGFTPTPTHNQQSNHRSMLLRLLT